MSFHTESERARDAAMRLTEKLEHYIFEPGHEEMCLMSYANNKGADQPAHPRSLISTFLVRCLDSIIIFISRFYSRNFKTLANFCGAQAGLCLAWSETPEDMFCRVVVHFNDVFTLHAQRSSVKESLKYIVFYFFC